MEVQKKLYEKIEVQKHLQFRIEAQGKYLQMVLMKAQEALAGYGSSLKSSTLNEPSFSKVSNASVYKASYGDSSLSLGYLSQDVLTITLSERLPNFVYGCGQDNQGLFGRSSGIIGMANDELSMLAQLSGKYGNAFSYSLPTSFSAANSTKEGFLSIGTSSLTASPYKFTPLLKNPKVL